VSPLPLFSFFVRIIFFFLFSSYDEAAVVLERLEEAKSAVESQLRSSIHSQHLLQKLSVEKAHVAELEEFNRYWDSKTREFEQQASSAISKLNHRQVKIIKLSLFLLLLLLLLGS
jgi:hypothetical protein